VSSWARGGEGALAPSCRAPQGRDQTRPKGKKIHLFSTCGSRRSTLFPTCDNTLNAVAARLFLRPAASANLKRSQFVWRKIAKNWRQQQNTRQQKVENATCGLKKAGNKKWKLFGK